MVARIKYYPEHTSAKMVQRIAARMVISHSIQNDWILEHLDIKSAFLHEDYKLDQRV